MYKYLKLAVDTLFLIVSVMILAYLYLLNSSRPTCGHDCVLPAAPRIARVTQDSPPPMPVVASNKTTRHHPLPTETAHG